MKRITIRKKRDVDLLKARLDVYSDEWRTAQPEPMLQVTAPTNLTPTGKVRKPRMKKNNNASSNAAASAATTPVATPNTTESKLSTNDIKCLTKRKRSKSDKVIIVFFRRKI